ncbi:MAG: hypothetical protein GXO58_00630 [Thermodesulfobacteria bacterium]|nr:hypothetical protein [Thermodesulfobacteriota bacterium]
MRIKANLQGDKGGVVSIGLVVDAKDEMGLKWSSWLKSNLEAELQKEFPQFLWQITLIKRHDFPNESPVDPLILLEFGSDLKIEYGFDFVLMITSMPLKSRFSQGASGVPSNMLETAVISLGKILELENKEKIGKAFMALTKHLLGHLWGLDHNQKSVMRPRKFWDGEPPYDWSPEEKQEIIRHLSQVADPRLEEKGDIKSRWRFYLQVLLQEGPSIAKDIFLFRSVLMMFHLSRFIAATVVSVIFLFLSAEAWEMGAAMRTGWLDFFLLAVIIAATLSIYYGQNLQAIGKSDKMKEQAVRSKIVLFGTLLVGMAAFWVNLFVISFVIIKLLPASVLAGWAGLGTKPLPALHFSKLMATFGVLASAVGGNLEEEHDIKALLVFTEET